MAPENRNPQESQLSSYSVRSVEKPARETMRLPFRTETAFLPESEVEPTHVGGLSTLPEVHNALVVVLQLLWFCFPICIIRYINRHPVATKKYIAILAVEMACNITPLCV
jgi:hypothetical protein